MRAQFEIFPWNNSYLVGIPVIDEQHHKLASLINKLAVNVALNNDTVHLDGILDELNEYAKQHFKTEEAIWHLYIPNDPLEANHHINHENFFNFIDRTRYEDKTSPKNETYKKIVTYLVNWVVFHILDADKYLATICLGLQSGKTFTQARSEADDYRDDSKSILIDAMLHMVSNFSQLSHQLGLEIDQRQKEQTSCSKALGLNNSVINSMRDGLVTLDPSGSISGVNEAFCAMTGFSSEELVKTSPPFPFCPADRFCQIENLFERTWKDKHVELEITLQRKDGSALPTVVSMFHVKERGDQLITYVAMVKDNTERKLAEQINLQQSL